MQATMQAEDFCRAMMVELEDQWTHARGHQERHPIREKIRQLEWISGQVAEGADLSAILASGKVCDDAVRCLVCEELQPRWEAARPKQ
jgi:hypothetical protein